MKAFSSCSISISNLWYQACWSKILSASFTAGCLSNGGVIDTDGLIMIIFDLHNSVSLRKAEKITWAPSINKTLASLCSLFERKLTKAPCHINLSSISSLQKHPFGLLKPRLDHFGLFFFLMHCLEVLQAKAPLCPPKNFFATKWQRSRLRDFFLVTFSDLGGD